LDDARGAIGTTAGYSMDSFFAVHPDYGSYDDLKAFNQKAHEAGIKVILDNVSTTPRCGTRGSRWRTRTRAP